jgi:hypothetical protein
LLSAHTAHVFTIGSSYTHPNTTVVLTTWGNFDSN